MAEIEKGSSRDEHPNALFMSTLGAKLARSVQTGNEGRGRDLHNGQRQPTEADRILVSTHIGEAHRPTRGATPRVTGWPRTLARRIAWPILGGGLPGRRPPGPSNQPCTRSAERFRRLRARPWSSGRHGQRWCCGGGCTTSNARARPSRTAALKMLYTSIGTVFTLDRHAADCSSSQADTALVQQPSKVVGRPEGHLTQRFLGATERPAPCTGRPAGPRQARPGGLRCAGRSRCTGRR